MILNCGKVKKSCDGLVLNFLDRLFKAKQSFFDVTPKGQILARIRYEWAIKNRLVRYSPELKVDDQKDRPFSPL